MYNKIFSESLEFVSIPYLTKTYRLFNKLYFNNELNEYPFKIIKSKRTGAKVTSVGYKNDPSSWMIKDISFSKDLILSEDEVKGILLHEMIHIELIEKRTVDISNAHGSTFMKRRKELQSKVSFHIPLTEDITDLKVNPETVKANKIVAVILNTGEGITIFNSKMKNEVIDELKNFPETWLNKFKPVVVLTDNIELHKYPVNRKINIKNFKVYHISKNISQEILNTGEIIHKF